MGKTADELEESPSDEILQTNPKSSAITRRNIEIKRKKSFGIVSNGISQGATLEKALLSDQNRILAQENENLRQIVRGKNSEILDYKQQIFELSAQRISLEQKLIKCDKRLTQMENELKKLRANASQSETLLDNTFDVSVNDKDRQSMLQMASLIGDINELTKHFPSIIEKMYLLNKVARGCMGFSSNQTMASYRSSMAGEQIDEEEETEENEEVEEEGEEEAVDEVEQEDYNENNHANNNKDQEMVEQYEENETFREELVQKPMIATAIQEEDEEQEDEEEEEEEDEQVDESIIIKENEESIEEAQHEESIKVCDQLIQEKSQINIKNPRKSLRRVSFSAQKDTVIAEQEDTFTCEVNTTYDLNEPKVEIADKNNVDKQETNLASSLDTTFDKPKIKKTLTTYESRSRIKKIDDDSENDNLTNKTYNIESEKEEDEVVEEENLEEETLKNEENSNNVYLSNEIYDDQASPAFLQQKPRIINLFEDSLQNETLTSNTEPTPKPASKTKSKTKQKVENKAIKLADDYEEPKKKLTKTKIIDDEEDDNWQPNKKRQGKVKKINSKIKSKEDDDDDHNENEVIEPKKKLTRTTASASKLLTKAIINDDNIDTDQEDLKKKSSKISKIQSSNLNAKHLSPTENDDLKQIRKNIENLELKHQQKQKQIPKPTNKTFVINKSEDESEEESKVVKEKPPAPPITKSKQVLKLKQQQQQQPVESIKSKIPLTKSINKNSSDVNVDQNDLTQENQDPSLNSSEENISLTSNGNDNDNGRSRRSRKQVTYKELSLNW
jgi:hypothetical protein